RHTRFSRDWSSDVCSSDLWLAAQNQGDFAAYQAMYAARFSGVRRSGAVTAAFDRAGWMKDRAGMFKRAMRVEVTGVTIERQGAGAEERRVGEEGVTCGDVC